MEITVDRVGEVVVVLLPMEELDASNSPEFRRDVSPVLDSGSNLVFDLRRVRFVDSSGLGAFISCLRHMNASGGDLKLCNMSKPVRTLFELGRMHRIFDIYDTRDEAVRSYQA